MTGLYRWIIPRFRWLFFVSAALLAVIMPVMMQNQERLSTDAAPKGIISLALAWSSKKSAAIKESWKACPDSTIKSTCADGKGDACCGTKPQVEECTTRLKVANADIILDYFFIPVYCSMLLLLLVRTNDKSGQFLAPLDSSLQKHIQVLMEFVLIAGLLDYTENIFMDVYFGNDKISPVLFSLPATIKFVLLITVGLYLFYHLAGLIIKGVSDYLHSVFAILWRYRVVTIGLLILYGTLWLSDQGQDILLMLNTELYGPPIFLASLTVLALLNWHLPKHFAGHLKINTKPKQPVPPAQGSFFKLFKRKYTVFIWNLKKFIRRFIREFFEPSDHKDDREKNVARVLGVTTILVPACGIVNALQQFDIHFTLEFINPYVVLFVSVTFFAVLFRSGFIDNFLGKTRKRATWSLLVFYIGSLIIIGHFLLYKNINAPNFLINLVIDLYLLAFMFALFVSLRDRIVIAPAKKSRISIIITSLGLFLTLFYLLMNIEPFLFSGNSRYLTFTIVVTGIIAYSILFSMLMLIGRRLNIDLVLLIIVAGFIAVISGPNEFHNVRTITPKHAQKTGFVKLNTIDTFPDYFRGWLEHRRDSIEAWKDTGTRYPVFIVNAYGGGIRAAAWTSMVISYLDAVMKQNYNQPFQHYVLAYSGASGGTIGLSVMCAQRYGNIGTILDDKKLFYLYSEDYLTSVLIGLQGRDIWCAPFRYDGIKDRAEFQERIWEKHLAKKEHGNINYSQSYFNLWCNTTAATAYEVPLLFINTYNLDDGRKGILAPVKLPARHFPGANFINDLYGKNREENLRLSTAAFLSARFPYISPSARFSEGLHFLDGGLKENSGAETATQLYRFIDSLIDRDTIANSLLNKIDVYVLSIRNTVGDTEPDNKADNVAELSAPLTGLINNFVGTTIQADSVNLFLLKERYYAVHPHRFCVASERDSTARLRPVFPLGWQISDLALQGMRQSLGECPESLDTILLKVFKCDPGRLQKYKESLKERPKK